MHGTEKTLTTVKSGDNQPISIVALLGSAGGLAPIQTILADTPDDTGAAFFVLQHLAPDNDSMLPDILRNHCSMPVLSAVHDELVQANTIYVAPPGYFVTLSNGQIALKSHKGLEIRSHIFNTFLESLAIDQKEKAVAIVLSGACDDGRVGAIVVRQAGGLVIVQDPETAEFRSMPDRVIEMNAADIVLTPENIAPMLVALIKDSHQSLSLDPNSSGYLRIMSILKNTCHVDFSRYKLSTVQRRISRRILLNKQCNDIDSYLQLISHSVSETELLGSDLLIGVSSFFRDKGVFEELRSTVIPELFKEAQGRELRLWVAGCATGEEAYSYAMLCLDYMQSQGISQQVKILASDINPESIRKANAGTYPKSISKQLPEQAIEKYFLDHGDEYQVTEELKKLVVFFRHDLTEDIPFSNIDLISCRNVFIYLKPEIQQHVVRCFGFGLKKEAF